MLLPPKLLAFRLAFVAVATSLLYGCASSGIQTPAGEQVTNVIAAFERGEARLTCEVSCSGAWGATRKEAKMLHDQGLWSDLAIEVAKVGFKADQTYFYLGRAAEGLGHTEAARTYYKLGLASSFKCAGIFNNCDGLVFPGEILTAINRLPAPTKAEAPVVGRTSTLIVPTENAPAVIKTKEEPLIAQASQSPAKVESPKVDLRPAIKAVAQQPKFRDASESNSAKKTKADKESIPRSTQKDREAFLKSAKTVLSALKKLDAKTSAGISYQDYSPALADVIYETSEFVEGDYGKFNEEFSAEILEAKEDYERAGAIWDVKFKGDITCYKPPCNFTFFALRFPDMLDRYPELKTAYHKEFGYYIDQSVSIVLSAASKRTANAAGILRNSAKNEQ